MHVYKQIRTHTHTHTHTYTHNLFTYLSYIYHVFFIIFLEANIYRVHNLYAYVNEYNYLCVCVYVCALYAHICMSIYILRLYAYAPVHEHARAYVHTCACAGSCQSCACMFYIRMCLSLFRSEQINLCTIA